MIKEFDFFEIRDLRLLLLNYPPKMTVKELFFILDQKLSENAKSYEKIQNFKMSYNNDFQKDWYPIISKSNAITSLFNQLENICARDRDLSI